MHGLYWGFGGPGGYASRLCGFANGSWYGSWFMITMMVLGVALVVVLAIGIFRRGQHGSTYSEALEIAKRRYANGEIDKDTYDRLKKDLR